MELPSRNEVLQSQGHVAESSPTQAWWLQDHFWEDGTRMTNTASLCQKFGGLKSRLFSMTNLHWKTGAHHHEVT